MLGSLLAAFGTLFDFYNSIIELKEIEKKKLKKNDDDDDDDDDENTRTKLKKSKTIGMNSFLQELAIEEEEKKLTP